MNKFEQVDEVPTEQVKTGLGGPQVNRSTVIMNRLIDSIENIIFPQLRVRAVNTHQSLYSEVDPVRRKK